MLWKPYLARSSGCVSGLVALLPGSDIDCPPPQATPLFEGLAGSGCTFCFFSNRPTLRHRRIFGIEDEIGQALEAEDHPDRILIEPLTGVISGAGYPADRAVRPRVLSARRFLRPQEHDPDHHLHVRAHLPP